MTATLDRRRHAFREDLADARLATQVEAPRFVEGTGHRVVRASTVVRRAPDPSLGLETELLFGETVRVFDVAEDWAWVQADRDGYVGYVPHAVLSPDIVEPNHKVTALGTFIYPVADIKTTPLMHVSINTPLAVTGVEDRFSVLATGGYVVSRHIAPLSKVARDFVDVAERLIGVPYLWGGRTRIGIDCSGLVQLAMQAAGLSAPRDSDMQAAEIGNTLLIPDGLDGLDRGDLVFWKGHVGIMTDGLMMLHANAHHMAVAIEPLIAAVQRIGRTGGGDIRTIKRPAALSADPISAA